MKKLIVMLTLIMSLTAAAGAEMTMYAARGTISKAQAEAMVKVLSQTLDQKVGLILEEETGGRLAQRVFAGEAPLIALLQAQEAMAWARAGMLTPLDACAEAVKGMNRTLTDACILEERLMLVPLFARRRVMAVRPERFRAANMGYLLDGRAHPVWYPSEVVQALDEMALGGDSGMDVWPPEDGNSLWLEALLQGVSGLRFSDPLTGAYGTKEEALGDALCWLEDMLHAGLIGAAEDRTEAFERFISGETAIFPDWTQEDSRCFAQEIRREEILLVPYPSLDGCMRHACEPVVLCAFSAGGGRAQAQRAAAALLASPAVKALRKGVDDDGADCLPLLGAMEYGATLRALLCDAARMIIAGEEGARNAARRIARAMQTMGW